MAIKEISEADKPFYLTLLSVGLLFGEVVVIALIPEVGTVLVGNGILAGTFTLVVSAFGYYFGKKA